MTVILSSWHEKFCHLPLGHTDPSHVSWTEYQIRHDGELYVERAQILLHLQTSVLWFLGILSPFVGYCWHFVTEFFSIT